MGQPRRPSGHCVEVLYHLRGAHRYVSGPYLVLLPRDKVQCLPHSLATLIPPPSLSKFPRLPFFPSLDTYLTPRFTFSYPRANSSSELITSLLHLVEV